MRAAFEKHCPDLLPGPRGRAIALAKAQQNGFAQQPLSAPRAERERPTTSISTGPRVKREATPPPPPPLYSRPFSIGPEYFEFPHTSPYAYKMLKDLSEEEQQKVAKQWNDGRLGGSVYAGLGHALQAVRPDLVAFVGA